MVHFLPTSFDQTASELIAEPTSKLVLPVKCDLAMVETTVIRSPRGVVVPLINWSRNEAKCTVEIRTKLPSGNARLASGALLEISRENGVTTVSFDLKVADALIFRTTKR